MNTNMVHNAINVVMILIAGVTAAMMASGCTSLPGGGIDCSASFISPAVSSGIIAALGVAKMVMNVFRDGVGGLVKKQPPVQK